MKSGTIITTIGILLLMACILQPVMAADTSSADNATRDYNLAEIAIGTGQFNQAVQYFDMALADNTTLLATGDGLMYVYKDKTAALAELGQYDEAMKTADLGISQFPKSAGLWNNKGFIYTKLGKYSEAADAYGQAVTIDKSYLKGWINKGNALVQAGKFKDAVDAYTTALTLDPGNAEATTGLAAAQKGAASPLSSPLVIVLVIVVILAAAGAVWYIKFRKTDETKAGDNTAKGKKKN
jgi:tetratricopeptide (TPR) repeat protein